jgi:polyphosphate kinase
VSEVLAKLWGRLPFTHVIPSIEQYSSTKNEVSSLVVRGTSERFFNRELSDLLFIERVMEESSNLLHPLFERVRFLAISSSVLDQFYAVRVAKLRRSAARRDGYVTPDGLTAIQQLMVVTEKANDLMQVQQESWRHLQSELGEHKIRFPQIEELDQADVVWLSNFFKSHFLHVLTPFTIDEEHPFPFISSGGLCAILEFGEGFVLLPLPSNLSRFIAVPGEEHRYVTAESLIQFFWQELVPGETLRSFGFFQILRDNDLAKEERNDDLRAIVESGLRMRQKANVIKLRVSETMTDQAIRFVARQLGLLSSEEILFLDNQNERMTASEFIVPTDLVGLSDISEVLDDLDGKVSGYVFPHFKSRYPEQLLASDNDCFAAISAGDMIVHWPYESFDSVIRFIQQAAEDPDVVSIKQTLYRTSDESPIVEALILAARKGKTVLTVIELEARDNEASNIELAKRLEMAGVQIIYGIVGLKIHCKATLVVRMEDGEAITYTHLGTGNYHPSNAKTYTDVSFFTRDDVIGHDTHLLFNYLTSERMGEPEKLIIAPYFLRDKLGELISNEIDHARGGRPGYICIKVNSLTDIGIIEKLYEASEAGVEIDLVIRRHCVLRPGVPGMSSRIRVKSIVGRFLEHSRIYMFGGGQPVSAETAVVYFGSADLMERNLDERAELLVPVENSRVKSAIVDGILHANIKDTIQSWILDSENNYERTHLEDGFCSQSFFMDADNPASLGGFKFVSTRAPVSNESSQ